MGGTNSPRARPAPSASLVNSHSGKAGLECSSRPALWPLRALGSLITVVKFTLSRAITDCFSVSGGGTHCHLPGARCSGRHLQVAAVGIQRGGAWDSP